MSPLFKIAKMIVRIVFEMFILLALFKAADGAASSLTNNLPSGCNCQPVVKLSVDGNSDLCKGNNQLLQEVNDLKKQLTTITDQLRQIIPQPGEKSVSSAHFFIEKICKQMLALRILYLMKILIQETKRVKKRQQATVRRSLSARPMTQWLTFCCH